ncbi:MAG: hypothetical protein IT210_24975 [Armatimonadetes bacterium]|nr:hypothetical protein [Armatimonadota bacterium]
MMALVYSLKSFLRLIEEADPYPFYAALLYTPSNGLDARLHTYVREQWRFLNRLTGDSCLLFAVEDVDGGLSIEAFQPEEVYDIARNLGVSVQALPCLVFFTDPHARQDILTLSLGDLFTDPASLKDEDMTAFFRELQALVDACSVVEPAQRLACLRESIARAWPQESCWAEPIARLSAAGTWLAVSATTGASLVQALRTIVATVAPLLGLKIP